jgi:hypothetical protein
MLFILNFKSDEIFFHFISSLLKKTFFLNNKLWEFTRTDIQNKEYLHLFLKLINIAELLYENEQIVKKNVYMNLIEYILTLGSCSLWCT